MITGHTGFKGSWLSKILSNWESNITGFSLNPPTNPNLYELLNLNINSINGDVKDFNRVNEVFNEVEPEIVIHMAAQPLVRESYLNPKYTYETNVMGTVNICEAVRNSNSVKSFLNVTTDKVYENKEWEWGYRENESLNGYDPYSNSKSCSDLITQSYNNSFFKDVGIACSTARAGNVIGGGDFAKDRIIPDCVRAAKKHEKEIKGLETLSFQAGLLDSIPYALQAKQLVNYIDSAATGTDETKEFNVLLDAYKKEDLDKLEELTRESDVGLSRYTDILLYNRNRNWVKQLNSLMQGKSLVIAVGAGHLPGEQGVINLLKKEGYNVSPIPNKNAGLKVI